VEHSCGTWGRCSFTVLVLMEGAHLNKGYLHRSGLFSWRVPTLIKGTWNMSIGFGLATS
jgi:hypothetical protein